MIRFSSLDPSPRNPRTWSGVESAPSDVAIHKDPPPTTALMKPAGIRTLASTEKSLGFTWEAYEPS